MRKHFEHISVGEVVSVMRNVVVRINRQCVDSGELC